MGNEQTNAKKMRRYFARKAAREDAAAKTSNVAEWVMKTFFGRAK